MELIDWFVGISIGVVVLLVVFLIYFTIYGYLWKPTISDGIVSSFVKSCNPFYCTQNTEFYGGASDRWLIDPRAEIIKPQMICHTESRGIFLVNVSCK